MCYACVRQYASEGLKRCPVCESVKPLDAFGINRKRKDGRQSNCRACWKHETRRRRYGLGRDAFEAILQVQDHKCALCAKPLRAGVGGLAVDHCKTTGKVRGILCMHCNVSLGTLGDTEEALLRVIQYPQRAC